MTLGWWFDLKGWISRAGRFGTKGLAITFVTSDVDQEVMSTIQARFEAIISELSNDIDPASYSMYFLVSLCKRINTSTVTS